MASKVTYEMNMPSTPRKRSREDDMGGLATPSTVQVSFNAPKKRNVESESRGLLTPERSPSRLKFGDHAIYSRTKAALQRSSGLFTEEDGRLLTRNEQHGKIMEFLETGIETGASNSLYITGPPGTGKTAQINAILKETMHTLITSDGSKITRKAFKLPKHLKNTAFYTLKNGSVKTVACAVINCIALETPDSVFAKIFESFTMTKSRDVKTAADLRKFLEQNSKDATFCVVLDEMDKLVLNKGNQTQLTKTIFELFLLAKMSSVNLLLIGIANSLDMKDRFLTRLNLERHLLPEVLLFQPYSAQDMQAIVAKRLENVCIPGTNENIFHPMALMFAAKKCSGNAGDLRKMFDILRNSVEVLELELISKSKKNQTEKTVSDVKKVGLNHVAKVFSSLMTNASTKSRLNKLNLQQKLVLCTIVHREKTRVFEGHCSLDDAYDYYTRLLIKKNNMTPLKRNEFLETCNALETCGVANKFQARTSGKLKIMAKMIKTTIDDNEFNTEMAKIGLLSQYLVGNYSENEDTAL